MIHKQLWFRLLFGSSFILIVALATAGVVLQHSTTTSFEEYVEDVSAARAQRIEALLSRYFSRRQDWSGVEPLVQQIADLVGQPVVLANSTDIVIVDTQNQLVGQAVRDNWKHQVVPIRAADSAVGTLYIAPLNAPNKLGSRGDAFVAELSSSLLTALAVGLLAALTVSILVARHLAAPLETLTRAVRRLGAGERTEYINASMGGEVGALAVAFNGLVDSLHRAEQLRSNMVNDIAHELRTPLTTVRGYVEALQDGVAEPTTEVLDTIHGELLQLTRLVDDLRDIALAEAGQLHLAPQLTSIESLIAHDLRALAVTASEQELTITTSLADDLPSVWVDAGRMSQALRNLLNNAVAHTPRGGMITVSVAADEQDVTIRVEDTGPGIPPDELPKVFERFYRGDPSRSRRAGGAGLGLSITRGIVAAHRGHLSVASPPGRGAQFTIRLPIHGLPPESPESPAQHEDERRRPAHSALGRGLQVLRLGFYGFMSGGLVGMVGGALESFMIATVSRRTHEALGLVPYAILIDAIAIGTICALVSLGAGLAITLRNVAPRFRDLSPSVGSMAIICLGAILALKWAQLTARDAAIPNATGIQLLIVGSTVLMAAVVFAGLSTAGRWPHQPLHLGRRAIPALAIVIGVGAFIGVLRDLSDRGYQVPAALLRTVHELSGGITPSAEGVASGLGTAREQTSQSGGRRPNVLLITVDALRADHLGAYGYQAASTPAFDALARDGWKVELAITPRAGSSAAHASIMTGTSPDRHRVRTNFLDTVAPEIPTLAEIMRSHGYTTAGLYSWFNFEPSYSGLDRGFQFYEDYTINLPRYLADSQTQALAATYRRIKSYLALPAATDFDPTNIDIDEGQLDGKADVTASAASHWLERRRSDPFFLWVHFRDPNSPYGSATDTCERCDPEALQTLQRIRAGSTDLSAPEINRIVASYDAEVTFVDRQVALLLRQLSQLGLDEETVVILAGAYGQSFGDHGAWLEGSTVYNTEIQVPILFRYPAALPAGRLVTQPASLLDIAPTILHLAGIATPPELEGHSLVSASEGALLTDRVVIAESSDSTAAAIISGEWKLIRSATGQYELYHLPADPDELLDRSENAPEITRHLAERLEQQLGAPISRGSLPNGN